MGRAEPVLATWVACLALVGPVVSAAAELVWPYSGAGTPPVRTADELESAIGVLQGWTESERRTGHADARIAAVSGQPGTDVRGRTMQQDLKEHYLSAATSARLDDLLVSARAQAAAHQDAALRDTLAEGQALVLTEVRRANLIGIYWSYQGDFLTQQQLIDVLAARLPPESRSAPPPEIRAALTAASAQLAAALTAAGSLPAQQAEEDKLRTDIQAVLAAYTQARTRLAGTVSASDRLKGIAPPTLERTSACPAPAPRTSGKDTPGFDPATHVSLADYYPAAMRRVDVEGSVVVAATVSAAGCPLKAEVEYGSGAPMLDEAALHYALDVRFLPAEHEQQPVQAIARFRVRFELND
jgi:TonB family protein